jgi:hypothetical protein
LVKHRNSKKDNKVKSSRSFLIKEGIAKARSRREKWGRPSIIETKGDPEIGFKASEMRSQGLSWSEIASNLKIGKTTSRRLVIHYQEDGDEKKEIDSDRAGCNRKVNCTFSENVGEQEAKTETSKNQIQDNQFHSNDDVLNKMPKTFQIFNSLLEKARKKQAK